MSATDTGLMKLHYRAPAGTRIEQTEAQVARAEAIIRAADCVVGPVSAKKGVRATAGKVVGQSPKIGTVLPAHAEVSIRIG